MNLCEDERTTIFLITFAVGGASYFFFIFKAYKHSKNKGYNPTFPIGPWSDFSKFLEETCSSYREHKDEKLKKYFVLKGVEKYLQESVFSYPELNNQQFFHLRFLAGAWCLELISRFLNFHVLLRIVPVFFDKLTTKSG